jgi:hypothetical protein
MDVLFARQRPALTRGSPSLPSALKNLTSVFGMGTGVASSLSPPDKNNDIFYYNRFYVYFKSFFILSKPGYMRRSPRTVFVQSSSGRYRFASLRFFWQSRLTFPPEAQVSCSDGRASYAFSFD